MPTIQGKAHWAKVQRPDTKFPKNNGGVYSIDICELSDEQVSELKSLGLKIKNVGDKRGNFFTAKRNEINGKGEKNEPPEAVDSQGNPFKGLIGNGSTVNVRFRTWTTENSYGKHTGAEFLKVQIVDLVEYKSENGSAWEDFDAPFEAVDGGFVAEGALAGSSADNAQMAADDDFTPKSQQG